jgi:hypothetical protein
MQVLRESMNGEKYCIYVAFEEGVPRNDNENFYYIHPMEQVFHVTVSTPCKCKKSQDIMKFKLQMVDMYVQTW